MRWPSGENRGVSTGPCAWVSAVMLPPAASALTICACSSAPVVTNAIRLPSADQAAPCSSQINPGHAVSLVGADPSRASTIQSADTSTSAPPRLPVTTLPYTRRLPSGDNATSLNGWTEFSPSRIASIACRSAPWAQGAQSESSARQANEGALAVSMWCVVMDPPYSRLTARILQKGNRDPVCGACDGCTQGGTSRQCRRQSCHDMRRS